MQNPFQYGKIAEKENFIDREQDRKFLKQYLYSGINTIVMSPRRWGKTSLVKRAMLELCEEHSEVRVCYIDVFPINTSAEFYRIFAREVIKATSSHWDAAVDAAKKFFKHLSPKISFGAEPGSEFTLTFDMDGSQESETEVLNLPEKIAKAKKLRIIVCIDEFQKLAKFPDYERLESCMRSVWQHHGKVSYCLYGSQRHMMEEIFNAPEKPFYRFGQIYPLKKIEAEYWVKYIKARFSATGKKIGKALAERITALAECHSWYVQQLASAVWNFTDEIADENALNKGLVWCIDINSEVYANLCDALSEQQIGLLRAVAAGEDKLASAEVMARYNMGTSASVVKNKEKLLKTDILVQEVGTKKLSFLDPMFKLWFRETMM